MPKHAGQDARGVVLPVRPDPGAWHAFNTLRELPEHGARPRVLALLVEHIQTLEIQQLLLALVEDLQERSIAHVRVWPLVLIVVAVPVAAVLLGPVAFRPHTLLLDRDPVLGTHELEMRSHIWMVILEHVVLKVQCARLLKFTQHRVESRLHRSRSTLSTSHCLCLSPKATSRTKPEAPHPDAVPDLGYVVIAAVEEVVTRRIATAPEALHDEIDLAEATGVGLRNGPNVLKQHNAGAVAFDVGEDAMKSRT
mmetsp:Transcript_15795/g.36920  ORF Transcript_15795/g.36920 Transcript_15795/m.36920 type:complete len:252 (+) Transcript_15795:401-1156(+)